MSAAVVGLLGGSAGLMSSIYHAFVVKEDREDKLRNLLGRAWTNEGDITGTEAIFITLDLKLIEGDVVGEMRTSAYERLLEAHLELGWFSSKLTVSELLGRKLMPVAVVRLKLAGNKNRLKWEVVSGNEAAWLPSKTLLWPEPVAVTRQGQE